MTSFLGKGWSFPSRWSAGAVALSADEEKIRQSIEIILSTARGERVMRPDFGCGIHEYVFATLNASVLESVREAVREALILWEPRIDVLTVEVSAEESRIEPWRGVLQIGIAYRVRSTNATFNMVYPFYLGQGGAT